MPQNHSSPLDEIVCEGVTDEITATYREQGFTLTFAEEVMRYDLSQPLPQTTLSDLAYLTWNEQSIHEFFTVYAAAFRERPGFPGWSKEVWAHWTADDPAFRPDLSFLATRQGQAVGFVTNAEEEEAPGQNGYLIQMGVDPPWRGQGLGASLMMRALQAWQTDGKEAVILHVNTNNPGAIRLYQQIGFVTIKRRGKFRR